MEHTKGKLEITEGIKIYIVPTEVDEIICEIPYDYAKDFKKTEQELLANAEHLVKCWNAFEEGGSYDALLSACEKQMAERINIGLDKPFWTPGMTELLEAALAQAKDKK